MFWFVWVILPISSASNFSSGCWLILSPVGKSSGSYTVADPYTLPLEEVYAKYRWYYLWPKIRFTVNEKKVAIEGIIVDEVKYLDKKNDSLFTKDNNLNGAIKQILLKPEGKKEMDFKSFKNGYLK